MGLKPFRRNKFQTQQLNLQTRIDSLLCFFQSLPSNCPILARNKSDTPNLEVFIVLLEPKIQCEREIAVKQGKHSKFRNKWTF